MKLNLILQIMNLDRPLAKNKNKQKIRLMKHELGWKIMKDFFELREIT